ncbi:MAG: translational GTPase TypA [Clostridia bacterium]|nr:translational GTPase TypA [Clostridia bacterium]
MIRNDIRNIAIIAHVDHGKTTLVDVLLKQSGVFRDNQVVAERVMDSNDLERERGITILSKNTSVVYKGIKINIIDTPGHADFGGEVERVLKMVNGVLLLVDAAEGPMPQTRFVLQKALDLGLKVIVVINKVDKPDARISEVRDEVLELFLELNASVEQLDSPFVFCSGRSGTASYLPDKQTADMTPLFETIINYIDPPEGDENAPLQMLISSLDYSDYVGRIGIGRVDRGVIRSGAEVMVCNYHGDSAPYKAKINTIYQFQGLQKVEVDTATVGDIVSLSGIEGLTIGDTVCDPSDVTPITFVKISEPTLEMNFMVNDSPFAGREGKYVTSRHLRDRLYKELLKDVSLKVSDTDSTECFKVMGRGEMHLSVLIETMRREGYEFQVSNPSVIIKVIDGVKCEPVEEVTIDVPDEYVGSVIEKLGRRKGEMVASAPMGGRTRLTFYIPSRGLFGYRNEFLTDTRGKGIMNSVFHEYAPYKGEIPTRSSGALIAFESGESITYGLFNAQERGKLFIGPGVPVYAGMVVGCSPKGDDIAVNVCKQKHQTNMRAAGKDEALRLTPCTHLSLEESLEFIAPDELLEITPKNIRIRKRILDHAQRLRMAAHSK